MKADALTSVLTKYGFTLGDVIRDNPGHPMREALDTFLENKEQHGESRVPSELWLRASRMSDCEFVLIDTGMGESSEDFNAWKREISTVYATDEVRKTWRHIRNERGSASRVIGDALRVEQYLYPWGITPRKSRYDSDGFPGAVHCEAKYTGSYSNLMPTVKVRVSRHGDHHGYQTELRGWSVRRDWTKDGDKAMNVQAVELARLIEVAVENKDDPSQSGPLLAYLCEIEPECGAIIAQLGEDSAPNEVLAFIDY